MSRNGRDKQYDPTNRAPLSWFPLVGLQVYVLKWNQQVVVSVKKEKFEAENQEPGQSIYRWLIIIYRFINIVCSLFGQLSIFVPIYVYANLSSYIRK